MTVATLRGFSIVLLSSALVALFPRARGCAGGDYDIWQRSIFHPEIINDSAALPFFYSDRRYYDDANENSTVDLFKDINCREWAAFFGGKVAAEDWCPVLYGATLGYIDTLIFYLKGQPIALPEKVRKNTALSFGDKAAMIDALYYVGFAKRVEPFTIEKADYWAWEQKKTTVNVARRAQAIQKLIEGGKKALARANGPFIRERYRFQVLRLYFYGEDYKGYLDWYENMKDSLSAESSVRWRSLGYAAGALYKLKRYAEANYRYSLIYDRYPPMKRAAHFIFHPQEEADWRQCLALASNAREKTVLWQLFGLYADGPEAMKRIYAIDPASDLLPLLIVREVNKTEEKLDFGYSGGGNEGKKTDPVKNELLSFSASVCREGKAVKPYVWLLATGHLYAEKGNFTEASDYLARAAASAPNNGIPRDQIRMSMLYARINAWSRPDSAFEPQLARELAWLREYKSARASTLFEWTRRKLAVLYTQTGDTLKAACLNYGPFESMYHDNGWIDRMAAFLDKPAKSAFESFLAGVSEFTKDDLTGIKAVNLLYDFKFAESAEAFRSMGRKTDTLPGDPFVIHINDCHDCDHAAPRHKTYTKADFADRLAQLNATTVLQNNAADRWFELANGLYNMTYYGNARAVYGVKHDLFLNDKAHYRCAKAEEYYKKAMELSNDREFKAKACFMAAKCEQNRFFEDVPKGYAGDFKAGVYFTTLKTDFNDTKYYQEIIRECGYFRTYIKK